MPVPLTLTQLFSNNAISLLVNPIGPTDTSLTVMAGYGNLFPSPGPNEYFLVTLEDQAAQVREIIKVTHRAGDTFSFTLADRGQEGTTPRAWTSAAGHETLVDHRVTAETMRRAMALPVPTGGGGSSWINGANTLSTVIDAAWQVPISQAAYSHSNRTFKFMVTLTHEASFVTRSFEVLLTISGNIGSNSEVVHATQYATVGPSIKGDLHALLNTSTKTLSLEWQNTETSAITAHVTRIQHFSI